jgi:hypothetical protein
METVRAWCVKTPDGALDLSSTTKYGKHAMLYSFVQNPGGGLERPWAWFYRRGYRAVRVEIREVSE